MSEGYDKCAAGLQKWISSVEIALQNKNNVLTKKKVELDEYTSLLRNEQEEVGALASKVDSIKESIADSELKIKNDEKECKEGQEDSAIVEKHVKKMTSLLEMYERVNCSLQSLKQSSFTMIEDGFDNVESNIQSLKSTVKSLEASLSISEKKLQEVRSNVIEESSNVGDCSARINHKLNTLQEKEENYDEACRKFTKRDDSLDYLDREFDIVQGDQNVDRAKKKAELEQARLDVEQAKGGLEMAQKKCNDLKEKLQEMSREKENITCSITFILNAKVNAEKKIRALETEAGGLNQDISQQEKALKSKHEEMNETRKNLIDEENCIKDKIREVKTKEEDILKETDHVFTLIQESKKSLSALDDVESKVKAIKSDIGSIQGAIEAKLSEAQKFDSAERKKEEEIEKGKKLSNQMESLKSQASELYRELSVVEEEIQKASKLLEKKRLSHQEKEFKFKEQCEKNRALQEECSELENNLRSLQVAFDDAERALKDEEAKASDLLNDIDKKKNVTLSNLAKEISRLEEEAEKAKRTCIEEEKEAHPIVQTSIEEKGIYTVPKDATAEKGDDTILPTYKRKRVKRTFDLYENIDDESFVDQLSSEKFQKTYAKKGARAPRKNLRSKSTATNLNVSMASSQGSRTTPTKYRFFKSRNVE